MSQQYPKWKFHRTAPDTMVVDALAEALLGDGWADHPSLVHKMASSDALAPPLPSLPATMATVPASSTPASPEPKPSHHWGRKGGR